MKVLTFFVPGIPAPQGSMRAFMPKGARFPVVTADNPKTTRKRATKPAATPPADATTASANGGESY